MSQKVHEDARRGAAADLVTRSIELIETTQAPSGAFVASPTFEHYRYAWLRDGAFIAEGLDLVGRSDPARRFHEWVAGVVLASEPGVRRASADARAGRAPSADDHLHCRFRVDGTRGDDDWPTFQLDGPGIWLWSLEHHVRHGGRLSTAMSSAVAVVARYLAALWATPCSDAWEEFGDRVHTSTLAAISAGLAAASRIDAGIAADTEVQAARLTVAERLSAGTGAWTKWDGHDEVDASLLWMVAPYGLVDARDKRFAMTLDRIERELVSPDGGVHRYRADTFYGGGEWPLLTAALGRVRLRRGAPGDRRRAEEARAWIEHQADARSWLPEQVATNALAPDRIAEWRERWGESARPLLWSHAAYLALVAELDRTPVIAAQGAPA